MKKYISSFILFIVGATLSIYTFSSLGKIGGSLDKILSLFSVPPNAHLAWMQLLTNVGIFMIHISFVLTFVVSLRAFLQSPTRVDKWMLGGSSLLVTGLLLLWFVNASYPVLFDTWGLLGF